MADTPEQSQDQTNQNADAAGAQQPGEPSTPGAGTNANAGEGPSGAAPTDTVAADPVPEAAPQAAAVPSFLESLEAEVKAAEKAGAHAAHAVLNDIHLLLTQVKSKAAAGVEQLGGEAAHLVRWLHRGL